MDSAGFILAINFFIGGIFALVFGVIAAHDAAYRSARWFALAYLCGMLTMSCEFLVVAFPQWAPFFAVAIFTSYLLALIFGNVGLARRYALPPQFIVLTLLFAVSVLINIYILPMDRASPLRMFLYQGPYFVAHLIGALIVFRGGGKRVLDVATGAFLVISAFNYLAKPFIAWAVGGPGPTPQVYSQTVYALYSQTVGAILAVALGILFIMVYVRDMLDDVRAESETDRLSNLLNRRGFEKRVNAILKTRGKSTMPVCLIICDLDHFKRINDEFGHAGGDRVIESFGELMRAASSMNHIVGRIGGEEFAIFLPSANGASARLFAESLRGTFAGMPIRDMPRLRRFTASFGVAEMVSAEDYTNLLRRADMALYEAKRDGRNRVCVAPVPVTRFIEPRERREFRNLA